MNHENGYIDLQVNGYAGLDFNRDDWNFDQLHEVCASLREHGVESIFATVISAPIDRMVGRLKRIVFARESDSLVRDVIAGVHLEGPFLNPGHGYIGAHRPEWTISTHLVTTTTTRKATAADMARHEAWVLATDDARNRYTNPEKLKAVFKKIGAEPPTADVGELIDVTVKSGGQSIFWRGGVKPSQGAGLETVEETDEGNVHRLVQRRVGEHKGSGGFKVDFLAYHWLGADLSNTSKATLQTLRLPPRLIMPFLILIFVSHFTKRNSDEALDRYYAKMKTEVDPDSMRDREKLEQSYKNPSQFEDIRMFPGTDFEFFRPRRKDIVGFTGSVVLCGVIVLLLLGLVSIGS